MKTYFVRHTEKLDIDKVTFDHLLKGQDTGGRPRPPEVDPPLAENAKRLYLLRQMK